MDPIFHGNSGKRKVIRYVNLYTMFTQIFPIQPCLGFKYKQGQEGASCCGSNSDHEPELELEPEPLPPCSLCSFTAAKLLALSGAHFWQYQGAWNAYYLQPQLSHTVAAPALA